MTRSWLPLSALLLTLLLGARGSALNDGPPKIVVPEIDDGVVVTWRPLTWDDFNGEIGRFRREAAGIASQVMVDQFRVDFEALDENGDEVTARLRRLRVYAAMNRLQSQYRPGTRSDWTLAHEQGHFDLTEVCARRLRGKLRSAGLSASGSTDELAGQALAKQVERLYKEALENCLQLQQRYDGETVHGIKKSRQKKWWKTIDQWLAETKDQAE